MSNQGTMSDPIVWPKEPHTAAKHVVLKAFFQKWVSIHSNYFAQRGGGLIRVYDGFAGPGVYEAGEEGSPVLMVRALCEHTMLLSDWVRNEYSFEFVELDPRRVERLTQRLEALETEMRDRGLWSERITWTVVTGAYQDHIPERAGRQFEALFLFLDPFGYAKSPMTLTSALMTRIPKCDLIVFLPMGQINRFLTVDDTEAANDGFFGSPAWRDLVGAPERPERLLELFENQLRRRVKWVLSFRLVPSNRTGLYHLVGASDDIAGFDTIKEAFWRADPVHGESFEAPRRGPEGQERLELEEPTVEADTGPLLMALRARFGTQWFSIEDAAAFTDRETRFRSKSHLKMKTLKPAEARAGVLEVERGNLRRGSFTEGKGIRMRFNPSAP